MLAATRIPLAAAAALALSALALAPALPASAHGAPTKPLSRTAACGNEGSETDSDACRAARKANGGSIGNFDNLRIPNVNGRDREVVPDGELCSGGLADYAGLDLARDDWPSTKVKPGGTIDLQYATTIPHEGSFRVYLTGRGYDPTEKLTWDDLTSKPLLDAQDPPLRDGAYRMSVKLPSDRSGRHVLYVIWQTSSTPDTYYSCSDLDLGAPPAAPAATAKAAAAAPEPKAKVKSAAPTPVVTASAKATGEPPAVDRVASVQKQSGLARWLIPGVLLVIVLLSGTVMVLAIRRGRRSQRIPRPFENR